MISLNSLRPPQAKIMRDLESPPKRNPSSGTYDTKEFGKAFISQREEFNYVIDEDSIDGTIPIDLCGSLFRNRPALFERG